MTSILRQNNVVTSFQRINDVIFTSCVPLGDLLFLSPSLHIKLKKQLKRSQANFVSKYIIQFLILKLYTGDMLFTVGQLKLMNKLVIDMPKNFFR